MELIWKIIFLKNTKLRIFLDFHSFEFFCDEKGLKLIQNQSTTKEINESPSLFCSCFFLHPKIEFLKGILRSDVCVRRTRSKKKKEKKQNRVVRAISRNVEFRNIGYIEGGQFKIFWNSSFSGSSCLFPLRSSLDLDHHTFCVTATFGCNLNY